MKLARPHLACPPPRNKHTPKMSSVPMTAARALLSTLPREELKKMTKEIREMITNAPKEEKVKRPAAVGQRAWFAFMAHCRATMTERFTTCKTAPEYAVVCGEIRKEDEAVYKAFVEKFKAENSSAPSDAPAAPAAPKPKPAAKAKSAEEKEAAKLAKELEKEQKAAAKSAEKEQKAATKSAEKAAKSAEKEQKAATKSAEKAAKKEAARLAKEGAHLAKEAAKEAAKQQKAAEKEAAKLAKLAAKPAKPTKAKAKAKAKATAPISAEATPAPAEPEEDVMPKLTIAGVTYFHDESSNGLYGIDAATNGLSHWVGFFQPDNEAEPIRYTASEGDDE